MKRFDWRTAVLAMVFTAVIFAYKGLRDYQAQIEEVEEPRCLKK